MNIGKLTRLNRIFSHSSGRFFSVAADHFIGYAAGLPDGLLHIQATLAAIAAARPDAVTLHKGLAATAWRPYAGQIPLILQSTIARPDDTACEQIAVPEDAVRLGADAFAVAAFVRGLTEAAHLRVVADCVRQASRFEMPVICHIYPRRPDNQVSFEPEDIAWAVHCAYEVGADVVIEVLVARATAGHREHEEKHADVAEIRLHTQKLHQLRDIAQAACANGSNRA